MADFTVSLSDEKAGAPWGENARLSFTETGAVIHLAQDSDSERAIAQAARKLDGLNLPAVTLTGDWQKEQQWAFALSFTRARHPGAITWADNDDQAQLAQEYAALVFTRQLVNDTPEDLSPETLAQRAAQWVKSLGQDKVSFTMTVGEALKDAGWVGIYNVGRGSERPPAMLELDYNPTGNADAPVDAVLVGKGITFDSGGYSIKSSEGMLDMKCDMGGAATVTGALGLAITQGINKRIKLILCCAENLISGHAYKLGDVLTYKNGVTVEVVNTDAEGRLVLADGLMAATETGAPLIIDAATLTGAAMVALGSDYHAVFSKDDSAREQMLNAAKLENERFWPLPLEAFHADRCPSAFADTANSRPMKGGGGGGASNAAGFLSRFVNPQGKGWVHLDLAAAYHGGATAEMPVGATAKGIRAIARMLHDFKA
ncbi:aminopeptidase B [Alteromonas australica]|jgi:PepB aminopeptidase|uniref:Aminopeptidase B n=2 Tax=Alteromonas australica TaxID=589873 RepID=A0A075PA91_9ALTE|nr:MULTISPECIES: aminopeptidase PepB [Alteromonas]MAF70387.1 aminopeptidase PepB [Alteromonas sp.]AIG00258.1 aminopeptidase B [Alteromonas australica]AJP45215.1 aminopeptidase B [Alteromonas australica]MAO30270.1 aminopeptidase PepB [Alteromonas sp.]QPL50480.1 aminopeptidase PepB [Alteromonas sp. B31-7]|tara:strand:+ start:322 stop:1611 length:1290 start_codon:yes stop_codon:yes gene_type:complete